MATTTLPTQARIPLLLTAVWWQIQIKRTVGFAILNHTVLIIAYTFLQVTTP